MPGIKRPKRLLHKTQYLTSVDFNQKTFMTTLSQSTGDPQLLVSSQEQPKSPKKALVSIRLQGMTDSYQFDLSSLLREWYVNQNPQKAQQHPRTMREEAQTQARFY